METGWILDEIATGLQKLYLLSLDRTPAAELLAGTAQAWLEAITTGKRWERARDAQRFRAAFITLAQTRSQWPGPVHFLDALPRHESLAIGYEIKPADPDRAEAAIAEARALLNAGRHESSPEPELRPSREEVEAAERELRQHYQRDGKAAASGEYQGDD